TAACASATVASGAYPRTCPVAGFREGNVRAVVSSWPSMSNRLSTCCPAPLDRCSSPGRVDDSRIILLAVMETSFSLRANHTFAIRELKERLDWLVIGHGR